MSTSAHQVSSGRLRELRERAGLTPGSLADLVGCSRRTIQRAEQGHVPVFPIQAAIAATLSRELRLGTAPLDHLDLWPLVVNDEASA